MKLVAVALLAALAGVSGTSRATVLAASSLSEVFPRIDATARYSFAGSDQLAFQIRQGAPADVFAAASPKYPGELYADRLVERPRVFATNELVLIAPRANPARIRSVEDLRRDGIKLVIGERGVPIGDYTRVVLTKLGLQDALANVVSEETDVKQIVGKIALGEADAGFVYATDVRPVRSKVLTIRIPDAGQPRVQYEIAVVKRGNVARGRAFVARVLGKTGRTRLAAAGFGLP